MGRKRTIDRDAILDAAEEVVSEQGAKQLTFDAVAARAGVSKGGLLYCFPNKPALIAAMTERDLKRFALEVDAYLPEGADDVGVRLRARIKAVHAENAAMAARAASLMAALVETKDEARILREDYEGRLDTFGDNADGRRMRLAFLACEGAFMLRGLGIAHIGDARWDAIFADILSLLDEKAGES